LIPPFGLVRQINSKGFQGVFSIVLENKKDIGGIPPTSKSIEPKKLPTFQWVVFLFYRNWAIRNTEACFG
ncbi:hypothetical protein, partial [Enterococcus sp. LJL51]|uniref:hypothetical protein n=1 Tax=Enterococcus sp. LJL51 TaxID=3416656 RepID=UPI003CFBAF85